MLGEQLILFTPEFMLVFKLCKRKKNKKTSTSPWGLCTATFFVVSASQPFIHQMVGPTDVIEVLVRSLILWEAPAVERQTPSGLTCETAESTFSGEVMREPFCGQNRGVLLEPTGNDLIKHKSRWQSLSPD